MIVRKNRPRTFSQVATRPQRTDVAVITCHFNFAGFDRPVQNLHRFVRQMERDGVSVYGVEAQLPGRPFATRAYPHWKQVTVNHNQRMFQKEALLNIAESLVPSCFTKVAWVDCDLLFTNAAWLEATSKYLEDIPAVQPFGMAWWTNKDGTVSLGRPPATLVGLNNAAGHPGFAWAARRTLFSDCGGLYFKTPVGSGDTIFTTAVTNQTIDASGRMFEVGSNLAEFSQYKAKVQAWMGGKKAGFIPGDVFHEWHGDRNNRQYTSRRDLIKEFDCAKHLQVAANGLIEWTEQAPKTMIDAVANYFIDRKEDG